MPDKWEYPWYAAWDLAFHCIPIALVDPDFAKQQLTLLTREWYMHPNGQLPAYEWPLGDVNPPVHAWAALRVYQIERRTTGQGRSRRSSSRVFLKLMLNFTWWVNRKDALGKQRLRGRLPRPRQHRRLRSQQGAPRRRRPRAGRRDELDGHVLPQPARDRARARARQPELPGRREQVLRALPPHRARHEPAARGEGCAAVGRGGRLLLRRHASARPARACRCASARWSGSSRSSRSRRSSGRRSSASRAFVKRARWFLSNRPELARALSRSIDDAGHGQRRLLSLLDRDRLVRVLVAHARRDRVPLARTACASLSRAHTRPARTSSSSTGSVHRVDYEPGEIATGLFGGNSNWRGPIWFPVNYLIIESLQKYHHYYGDASASSARPAPGGT